MNIIEMRKFMDEHKLPFLMDKYNIQVKTQNK